MILSLKQSNIDLLFIIIVKHSYIRMDLYVKEVEIKEKVYPKDLPKDFDQATMFLYKLATVSESNPPSFLPDKHQLYNNGDHLQRHMHPSNRPQ